MFEAVRRRTIALVVGVGAALALVVGTAQAAYTPVDAFAGYEPQTTCSPAAKPGTAVLGKWIVKTYGGRYGSISRSCAGRSVSEHKEGRAFDWTLDARRAGDRARAARLLNALFATGPTGERAELARRMGVMYVIWNDRIYSSYRGFAPRPYLSSGCKSLRRCSKTLRHRDHVHLSLSRDGGRGWTSWYAGRVAGRPVLPAPTPTPTPTPTSSPTPTSPPSPTPVAPTP